MKRVRIHVAAMLLGVCGDANAQQREPSAPADEPIAKQLATDGQTLLEDRYYYCNGIAGRSTRQLFRLPTLGKAVLFAMATIRMDQGRADPRWDPSASIGFAEEGSRLAIRLQMHFEPSRPDEMHFTISNTDELGVDHQFVTSLPKRSDGTRVVLRWMREPSGGGRIAAVVGGKNISVPDLKFKPNIFELSCSAGDFAFEGIALLSE